MSWQTVTFLVRTLQPDPPVQEYSAGKTFTMCQTLFQNPRVVELILGSIHMHQCLLITVILASEATVKTSPSYEPKQLGKNKHHTNMYQNVCVGCLVIWKKNYLTNHEEWCERNLILRALWFHEPLVDLRGQNQTRNKQAEHLKKCFLYKTSDTLLWCILHRLKTSTLLKWNKNKRFLSSSGNFLPMDFE